MWFFVHKMSSNTNIKFISCLVDGMQLMIFGELEIVGLKERPTYKKKKKRHLLGHNDIKYWNSKLLNAWALQGKFGVQKAATTIWKSHILYLKFRSYIQPHGYIDQWNTRLNLIFLEKDNFFFTALVNTIM